MHPNLVEWHPTLFSIAHNMTNRKTVIQYANHVFLKEREIHNASEQANNNDHPIENQLRLWV